MDEKIIKLFLSLVKAGLWEEESLLSYDEDWDYNKIVQLSEEQAVLGLVAAGIDYLDGIRFPQNLALNIVSYTLQIEEKNRLMNLFIADILGKLRDAGIDTLLVKGQGIAQCYKRPLWRACGDIDLFF